MKYGKALMVLGIILMFFSLTSVCFAESITKHIRAFVPTSSGLNVTISKIRASDNYWYPGDQPSIDFGTLVWDDTNNIWRSDYYYAVDVGVSSNAPSWSLQHTKASFAKVGGGDDLDGNTNVAFVKQTSQTTDVPLGKKVSFGVSTKTCTKSELAGGWLRIYYGLATGDAEDADDVVVIGIDKTQGQYQGTVTITLTQ